ncbi:hypothetical protein [Sphingomonas abietis]|uniref:Uncharacterized protein n=1 Tax=Sphingomonas abietis TaxID=3012344 RepID=A0ABY7NJG9_9SPHN|nr:hypothetical protein [Sphingomonas abietis]WBO21671.1 hypothetical protein PBT88_16050 [Sphingomonas abietis]
MSASHEKPSLPDGVESIQNKPPSTAVSDELRKLMALLSDSLPHDAAISFLFDTRLHVRIDVRQLEQVQAIEMMLPTLGGGIFHDVQRGQAPNHSFLHRVTALVDR